MLLPFCISIQVNLYLQTAKGSIERLYEHPLQLTAYIGAVNECYQEYDLKVNHALLVVAIPDMPAEIFWFEPEAMKEYWQQWEKKVAQYWERRKGWGW